MSDREAEFREFVGARMESLRGLAYLTCGDWQVAEDAVLRTLAKLYGRWHRVDNPEAWARTSVVRAAIDETRRPWWRREQAHEHAALPDRAGADTTPEVDERLRLRQALGRVPAKQRAVLVLRFYEDCDVAETARLVGCSEGTVKSQTARGLARLRELLATADPAAAAYWEK